MYVSPGSFIHYWHIIHSFTKYNSSAMKITVHSFTVKLLLIYINYSKACHMSIFLCEAKSRQCKMIMRKCNTTLESATGTLHKFNIRYYIAYIYYIKNFLYNNLYILYKGYIITYIKIVASACTTHENAEWHFI